MKPVEYLMEVTQNVQKGVDSAMHNDLVYNSEDEGDVLQDCLKDYLEVSAHFMEQLVPELKKHADPQKHPVLCARISNPFNMDGDSPYGMEHLHSLCLEFAKGGNPLIHEVDKIVTTLDISANTEMASKQVDDMMPFLSF
jgi:hypothetical protein